MASFVSNPDNPGEFSLDFSDAGNYRRILVLAVIAKNSIGVTFGIRASDFYWHIKLSLDEAEPILKELEALGLITIKEQETGTAGIKGWFYKLADGANVQVIMRVPAPPADKAD